MMSDVSDNVQSWIQNPKTKQKRSVISVGKLCPTGLRGSACYLQPGLSGHYITIKLSQIMEVWLEWRTTPQKKMSFSKELKDFSGHCLQQEINTNLNDYKMTTETLHNAITFVQ